jgi:hypothetical protein
MTNPTSNYGWVLPNSADLVTDLPADFEVALQGVDTTTKALNPSTTLGDIEYRSATANTNTRLPIGTTGQVLSVVGGVPAWTTGTTGDIEGVTAGVGISGGGTSGTVTVTNSMATAIKTAGDLIKGTGSGTFDRLGIGSTGQVLTVSSGAPAWVTPAGGGKILQVVSNVNATSTSTTSTSYVDSGLTASITPSSSSSRIYVVITQSLQTTRAGNDTTGYVRLVRGSTTVWNTGDVGNFYMGQGSGTETTMAGPFSVTYVDSPATTSSTTYKTQIRNAGASQAIAAQFNNSPSTITLLEVGP